MTWPSTAFLSSHRNGHWAGGACGQNWAPLGEWGVESPRASGLRHLFAPAVRERGHTADQSGHNIHQLKRHTNPPLEVHPYPNWSFLVDPNMIPLHRLEAFVEQMTALHTAVGIHGNMQF